MSLPDGASFQNGEVERVAAALNELAKDPHAPREISVKVVLRVHRDYPRHLYKENGDSIIVADSAAEEQAAENGYGRAYVPKAQEE